MIFDILGTGIFAGYHLLCIAVEGNNIFGVDCTFNFDFNINSDASFCSE